MFSQAVRQLFPTPQPRAVIPFPTFGRNDARDEDLVASVLLAMEGEILAAPVVLPARGMDGVFYVGVSVGPRAFRLTPAEARLTADAIWADTFEPGSLETAARLRDAAQAADRAVLRGRL